MNDNKNTTSTENTATIDIAVKKKSFYNSIIGKVTLGVILALFFVAEIAVLVLIFMLFLSFYVAIIIGGAIGISTVFIMTTFKKHKAKKSGEVENIQTTEDVIIEEEKSIHTK